MNVKLAEIIRSRIEVFPWVDKIAGVVNVATVQSGDTARVFPIACNVTHDDCINGKFTDLVPNSKYKSVMYFEDGGIQMGERRGNRQYFEGTLNLVCWLNMPMLGDVNCHNAAEIISDIASTIPLIPFNSDIFTGIFYKITSQKVRDAGIFSKYSYRETINQYLMYPYEYFSVAIQVKGAYNVDCYDRYTPGESIKCPIVPAPPPSGSVVVTNSNGSFLVSITCGMSYTLPDISFTDSDGTHSQVPAQTDITATPCKSLCTLIQESTVVQVHDCMTAQQVSDYETAYCPTCADATVKNSDNTYNVSVAAGATLTVPDSVITDGDGTTVNLPATKPFTAKTLSQLVQADGGFYMKLGLLPDNYTHFEIDPVQANNRMWFVKYNTATIYRNNYTTLANVATIAAGANITSHPRYHNGLVYFGTSGGQIVIVNANTDAVLTTISLGVATIVESMCVDTINNRLYVVTTSGAKVGYLWQFNIVAAPTYLTYVTDFQPFSTAVYVACDNVNQRIYVRALAANGTWSVYNYSLVLQSTTSAIFPTTSQCRGFSYDDTFDELLMMSHDAQLYRVTRLTLAANYDSLPAVSNFSDTGRTWFFRKIPWETRKYFAIAVKSGTRNGYSITTR